MGHRYRVSFDVVEEESGNVTIDMLREMTEAARSAAKLVIPPEKNRVVKVDTYHSMMWHAHHGDKGCSTCSSQSADGLGNDVSTSFPSRPSS